MKKINLKIDGMHCSSCAMNIDFDLEDLKGVISTKTNYARQTCEVEFDPNSITAEGIINQIKATGYKAQIRQ